MTAPEATTPAVFAASAVILLVAHNVADHTLGQTDQQAEFKAAPGSAGWRALLGHLVRYHLVLGVIGLGAWLALPLRWSVTGLACAVATSVITHALLDRRHPLRWLLEHTGKRAFAAGTAGLPGMYLADQALHHLALGLSAMWLAVLR